MSSFHHALIPLTIVTLLQLPTVFAASGTAAIGKTLPSRLRDDLSAVIPACAETCLLSFVDVNYAKLEDDYDADLSLEYVCAYRGRSGYTIGEGALQCLTGEKEIGFCNAVEAGDLAFSRAYRICDHQPTVAKPNNGVITATLQYAPDRGILTFAPITSTSKFPEPSTSTKSTSSTTSSEEETLSTATPTSTSTLSTSSSAHATTTTTTTTTTPTPTQTDAAAAAAKPLSKGQIAGISIGAACLAVGVAFGVILLARYLIRRRRRHSGSTIGSFHGGKPSDGGGAGRGGYVPARDTWGYGFDKTSQRDPEPPRSSWLARHAPGMSRYPPMPGSSAGGSNGIAPRRLYNRESWRPSAVGLAISPSKGLEKTPTPTPTRPRPLSKLLPAKPDMPAVPPKNGPSSPPQAHLRQPSNGPSYLERQNFDPQPQQQQYQPKQPQDQQYSFPHPIAAQFQRPAPTDQQQRPTSLRLVIPSPKSSHPPPQQDKETFQPQQYRPGRDSTMTEFEEDGCGAGRRPSSPAGQIWRPPSAVPDSAAATTYYVADGAGNWILGDPKSAVDGELQSPLSAAPRIATARSGVFTSAAVQTHIPARRSREESPPAAENTGPEASSQQSQMKAAQGEDELFMQPPQELAATPLLKQTSRQEEPKERDASPTATTADPKTPKLRSLLATPKAMPSPLFSRQPNPRSVSQPLPNSNSLSQSRSLTARPVRSRATSADSGITTFSISSETATDDDNNPKTPTGVANAAPPPIGLSPVAESPRSRATASNTGSNTLPQETATITATTNPEPAAADTTGGGVSPVSYPRIPSRGTPGLRGRAFFPGVPPPRMPSFAQESAGQPSPTLGTMTSSNGAMTGNGTVNANTRDSTGRGFQRQPPYLPYGGHTEQYPPRHPRGSTQFSRPGRGRGGGGRGGMIPSPSTYNMHRESRLRPPPQILQEPRTGSPTMRIVSPSPEPPSLSNTNNTATNINNTSTNINASQNHPQPPRDDRSLLPSSTRRRPPSHLPHPFPMYPQPRPRPRPNHHPSPVPPQSQQRDLPMPDINDVSHRDSLSRYPGHPMPIPQPYQTPSSHQHHSQGWRPPRPQQPYAQEESYGEGSQESSSPSLLVKRLGDSRAADMALSTGKCRPTAQDRWRQQQQQQQQQQNQQGEGNIQNGAAQGAYQKKQSVTVPDYPVTPDLPSTPTWLPRLTPTRRGTDLVLNVG